jgi:hypothetical protein
MKQIKRRIAVLRKFDAEFYGSLGKGGHVDRTKNSLEI